MAAVKVGEERVEEHQLGVGGLPDQEIRHPLLAGRPDEQVDVGDAGLVQVTGEHRLVDPVGAQLPGGDVRRDRRGGINDLGAAAVVDAELQGQHRVARGHLLGVLKLPDHAAPQPGTPAGPAHPHAHLVQLIAAAADYVAVEAHQEADLVRRAPPVLGGERVGRQVRDAQLDGSHDHVEQRVLAPLVAFRPRQVALLGPAAVAIHDQGHMPGHERGRNRGRTGATGMRVRRPDLARHADRAGLLTRTAQGCSRVPAQGLLTRAPRDGASGSSAPGAIAGTRRPVRCTRPDAGAR